MGKRKQSGKPIRKFESNRPVPTKGKLRIIGGKYRGRQIDYSGDFRTRPMKDNVREALFNLVGGWIPGKYVFDLFAGTGAIGIEAISRGAIGATLVERHIPTARIITSNLQQLEVSEPVAIDTCDSFFWVRQFFKNGEFPDQPWAVFVSPPYDFYVSRQAELVEVIQQFCDQAPLDSIIAVEADERFSSRLLPYADQWRTRIYTPALVSIFRKTDFDHEQILSQ